MLFLNRTGVLLLRSRFVFVRGWNLMNKAGLFLYLLGTFYLDGEGIYKRVENFM